MKTPPRPSTVPKRGGGTLGREDVETAMIRLVVYLQYFWKPARVKSA